MSMEQPFLVGFQSFIDHTPGMTKITSRQDDLKQGYCINFPVVLARKKEAHLHLTVVLCLIPL